MSKPAREIIGRLALLALAAMFIFGGWQCLRRVRVFGEANVQFGMILFVSGIALLLPGLVLAAGAILPVRLLVFLISPFIQTGNWMKWENDPLDLHLPEWMTWLPWWW